ncbi:MAG: flagellar type III secretion system pore protein FliP [Fimbriimonadaceae bacterium]|nr:flagellar type III secretion system pore protein FliP [Fimbriimonadaceae bacterium]
MRHLALLAALLALAPLRAQQTPPAAAAAAPTAAAAAPARPAAPAAASGRAASGSLPLPGVNLQLTQPRSNVENYSALQVMFLLTAIVLAPTMLLMLTCFTRIIVVLGFLRQALGTQQVPPNQVLIGLALFMTLFIMAPTWRQVQTTAIEPYVANKLTTPQALEVGLRPIRAFMLRNTRPNDLLLFIEMAREARPRTAEDCPTYVLIPAFCLSELKTAFEIGFLIYLPFLVIDVVVASTVMSMGMMMLPPVIISLPFKLLLFVLVDGWHLILRGLAQSFG